MIISNSVFTVAKIVTFVYICLAQCRLSIGLKLAYDEIVPPGEQEQNLAPIIMMHGRGSWRKEWKHVAPDIAKNTGRKIYAIDARNHGDSPLSSEHTYETMADDLDEFLEEHNISKVILVGLSMGGRTTVAYALRKPEKVEKIVVEDMKVGNYTNEEFEIFRNTLLSFKTLLEGMTDGADLQEAKETISRYFRIAAKQLLKVNHFDWDLLPIKEEGGTYVPSANMDLLLKQNLEDAAIHLCTCTYDEDALFVYGDKSAFHIAEDEKTILKYFPRATLLVWNSRLHNLHIQFPEKFIQAVSDFINNKKESSEL